MSNYHFTSVIPIEKGWSGDRKFCVTDETGTKYLLRISPADQYERKLEEFQIMQTFSALGIPMCQPLQFGRCKDYTCQPTASTISLPSSTSQSTASAPSTPPAISLPPGTCAEGVYSLQSWIDGTDAGEAIHSYSETQQYVFGLESGRILKTLHSIPIPQDDPAYEIWETRYGRKIDRKLSGYENCPLKYENGEPFLKYIEENRHLIQNRPQVWQHGDYHIGNMMIDNEGQLQIIDFNRKDYGDPWEEFNRIVWCAQAAPFFATGMVDGYFDGKIPLEFWKLLALYISTNTLSSLPWAIPFGQKEIDTMTKQANDVLSWHDNMTNPIPTWYVRA